MRTPRSIILRVSPLCVAAILMALFGAVQTVHAARNWSTYQSGSSGENVRSIQYMLVQRGHRLTIDGQYGPITASVVKSFQSKSGLSADGIVDPQTWEKLIVTTRSGSKGNAVKALQRQLNAHGFKLKVNGSFNAATKSAVKSFQRSKGLSDNGVAGLDTWSQLIGSSESGSGSVGSSGDELTQVTDQAYGTDGQYVPNSWGVHKNRIVRTTNGDLFTVYISPGQTGGEHGGEHTYHIMKNSNGTSNWQEVKSGDAGAEEVNVVRDPQDGIHVFTFPNGDSMHEIVSTDAGQTWKETTLPGANQWFQDQGYVTASANASGDLIAVETGDDQPGMIYYDYFDHATHIWSFHTAKIDTYRYTYGFFFPGVHHDLTFVAMRDAKPMELGYNYTTGQSMQWIFNAIGYFYIPDVLNPVVQKTMVTQIHPLSHSDYDVTYLTDAYMDTQGRTHILYDNQYDGLHHAIVDQGRIIKNVTQNVTAPNKVRITQDTMGHFYLISMDSQGQNINVYPGTASDTDGTQLAAPARLDISRFPGCTDDDFCHAPTFIVPRGGNPLSNTLDTVYGNFSHVYSVKIHL